MNNNDLYDPKPQPRTFYNFLGYKVAANFTQAKAILKDRKSNGDDSPLYCKNYDGTFWLAYRLGDDGDLYYDDCIEMMVGHLENAVNLDYDSSPISGLLY